MATPGILTAVLAGFAAYTYGPATQSLITRLGLFRQLENVPPMVPADLLHIKDTIFCEDIHYYAPANTLFTACEDSTAIRPKWWPPLVHYEDPTFGWQGKGSIHVIDPEVRYCLQCSIFRSPCTDEWPQTTQTKESKRLTFGGFDSPFITHGIDVIPDPETAENEAVYIFAVNHVPNEAVVPRDGSSPSADLDPSIPAAASRIEVYRHVIGSDTAEYKYSIAHPLIKTPNDIYAVSPKELYITNDHHYFTGHLRGVEDIFPFAKWSNLIHAKVADDGSIEAEVALDKLHNPNGLGHGRAKDELLLTSASGGTLRLVKLDDASKVLAVDDLIAYDSFIDNPSWYLDPYADEASGDASGFVLGGIATPLDLANGGSGSYVWYTKPSKEEPGKWNTTLLWQDDGTNSGSAATALLVGIDPQQEGGKKKAWLYVAGFQDESITAVKVDLP